ncbi:MAG: lysostaphin resistance A-like protein [Chitinophagales bacterium]
MGGPRLLGLAAAFQVLLIGAGEALLRLTGRGSVVAGLVPGLPWNLILGTGAAAGLVVAVLVFGLYRLVPVYAAAIRPVVQLFRQFPGGWLWVVAALSPVGEEAFFRGALQPLLGLFGAALVFGVLHTGFRRSNLAYGLTAAAAGCLFGLAFQYTGELWAPVVAHALYNTLAAWMICRLP